MENDINRILISNIFQYIKSWKRGDERAPHKPLLALLAIGRLKKGQTSFGFDEIESSLKNLLNDFGPPRNNVRPEYPFVRLASDGIWTFDKPELIKPNTDYSPKRLREFNLKAGFTPEIINLLTNDEAALRNVVNQLLEDNFPETYHQDILDAVGLTEYVNTRAKIRDPYFRQKVLTSYQYKCAVCDYNIRLQNKPVGIEAAHIKWHQAGGPANENNGVALCSTHHKLLDYGAFTLDDKMQVVVSENVNGHGIEEYLFKYEGKAIWLPRNKSYYPNEDFVAWHAKEVFVGYK